MRKKITAILLAIIAVLLSADIIIHILPVVSSMIQSSSCAGYTEFQNERIDVWITSFKEDAGKYYPYLCISEENLSGGPIMDRVYLWCESDEKAYFIGYDNRYIVINETDCTYVAANDLNGFSEPDQTVLKQMEQRSDLFLTSDYLTSCLNGGQDYQNKGRYAADS